MAESSYENPGAEILPPKSTAQSAINETADRYKIERDASLQPVNSVIRAEVTSST